MNTLNGENWLLGIGLFLPFFGRWNARSTPAARTAVFTMLAATTIFANFASGGACAFAAAICWRGKGEEENDNEVFHLAISFAWGK